MQAYWPFHKLECRRNEFADLIEDSEPKFARWMRAHGKIAVLKDDEVDRLERAAGAASGTSRQEVMESMYGRLEPKPQGPCYSLEERAAMRAREQSETALLKSSKHAQGYDSITVPADLGLECPAYKWRQNQSHVEIFIPLPESCDKSKVTVSLSPSTIKVELDERPILSGKLFQNIKEDESTWYIVDNILEISLLKRNRRGNYADKTTNADTFWHSVLKSAPFGERLELQNVPTTYYWSPYEADGEPLRLTGHNNAKKKVEA